MDKETLGVIYLGKKRHPPWEPIALVVMKPPLGFCTKNWTIVASQVLKI
jgi:hypothetical protein